MDRANLTAAATASKRTCAGGSQPDRDRCYQDTETQIKAAKSVVGATRSVPTPKRFAEADAGLRRGLAEYIAGLTEQNRGLLDRSPDEYSAGLRLVSRGLAIQGAASAKYPADSGITT
jgi:hypothetical protein